MVETQGKTFIQVMDKYTGTNSLIYQETDCNQLENDLLESQN